MEENDCRLMAEYRSAMYALAAEAFAAEPSDARLRQIINLAVDSSPDDCGRASERDLLRNLSGYADKDIVALGASIRTEFAELFIGPRRPLAPYYESAYMGHPKRMFTQTTKAVREFYKSFGVEVEKKNAVPDDLLAYELAFMSELCRREACEQDEDGVGIERWRTAQLEFLGNHLGLWVESFCRKVEMAWCADWYVAWSRFACDFVAEDIAYFGTFEKF